MKKGFVIVDCFHKNKACGLYLDEKKMCFIFKTVKIAFIVRKIFEQLGLFN